MIARVKLPTGVMYMALWRRGNGELVPLGKKLVQTAAEAQRMCREHVQHHLSAVSDRVVRSMVAANDNLERLDDEPSEDDRIVISGMRRVLDSDGAVVMPELHPGDDFFAGLADIKAGVTDMDERVLRDVAQGLGRDPDQARLYLQRFTNYLKFNPLALLSMLADAVEPDKFGPAALGLVELYRELIAKPTSNTEDEPADVLDLAAEHAAGAGDDTEDDS
jgi:hypothetical protein